MNFNNFSKDVSPYFSLTKLSFIFSLTVMYCASEVESKRSAKKWTDFNAF